MKSVSLAMTTVVTVGMTLTAYAQSDRADSGTHQQSALAGRAQALVANAPPMHIKAKISHIEPDSRIITLHGTQGHDIDVAIGPQVANFDQLRVGDNVEVLYKNALLVSADKVGTDDKGIRERVDSNIFQSNASGYSSARQVEVQATVLGIDAKKRELRLRGAYKTVTLAVGPDLDLNTLKPGDSVHAVFVWAYATKVTPVNASR